MDRDELKEFTEGIVGDSIGEEVFDGLLDTAQAYLEQQRPWLILRGEDTSQSVGSGATFETPFGLPTDFNRFYEEFPVQLKSGDDVQYYKQVPIARRFSERWNPYKFVCNYATSKLYLLGSPPAGYTIHQFYIKNAPLISEHSTVSGSVVYPNEWAFPERFHKALGWLCAFFYKNGVDYDPINSQQGDEDNNIFLRMWDAMKKWDADLELNSLEGLDGPYPPGPWYQGTATGGVIRDP